MVRSEILLKRLMSKPIPKQMRFRDLEKILISVGFVQHSREASHTNFKHPRLEYILTIVCHHSGDNVLPIYILNACRAIDDLIERGYFDE
jgi:predicted RNA binding protein YcfA (HicA-like mRNA interferase family)